MINETWYKSLPTMLVKVIIAAPQPIAAGAAARHIIQPKKRTKPFTVARNPQSFRRPSAAGQPRNRRQKTSRKVVSHRAAGALDDRSAANAHRAQQCQPAARAAGASSAAVGLNGMTVRDASIAPRCEHPTSASEVYLHHDLIRIAVSNNFPPLSGH